MRAVIGPVDLWGLISFTAWFNSRAAYFFEMKKIKLTQGQFALVADEHYEDLMLRHSWEKNKKPVKWCAMWSPGTKSFYAVRAVRLLNGKRINELMHRRILGLQHGDKRQGDHVNHDTLNNQPENLRRVTSRVNHENRHNQSKYGVGVQYKPRCKSRPFQVIIRINGHQCHIGMFATPREAQDARAYWLKNKNKNE